MSSAFFKTLKRGGSSQKEMNFWKDLLTAHSNKIYSSLGNLKKEENKLNKYFEYYFHAHTHR
jgi:hypothetical protein